MNAEPVADLRHRWPFDVTLERDDYVQHLLERYRRTPTVAGHIRAADRQLAAELYQRGTPLALAEAALTLAATRRIFRDPKSPPLSPVRSLHYFLPVIDELLRDPPDPDYIRLLDWKLAHLDQFAPWIRRPTP
jgi:hypothetical protein